MPTYEFKCKKCEHEFEKFYSFKEYDQGIQCSCPNCDSKKIERRYDNPPIGFVKGNENTIGQLAEKNSKKIGKNKIKEYNHQQSERMLKKKKPWYGSLDKNKSKEIFSTKDKQKQQKIIKKYIMEGE